MLKKLLALSLITFATACGSSDELRCNGSEGALFLKGSYCEDLDIVFDDVELSWFKSAQTVRVRYLDTTVGTIPSPRVELLIYGDMVVIEPGVKIDLKTTGLVRRWPQDAAEPISLSPKLQDTSHVLFETFTSSTGGDIKGSFHLLFDNGRVLQGGFEGMIKDAEQM